MTTPLEVQELTAGYRNGRQVTRIVHKASARLQRGEFACLLGINGAGKSTLLRTLSGLQPALSGSVVINGQPAHDLGRIERARAISLVLTERNFARYLTGLDVVRLGRFPHTNWYGRLTDNDHRVVDDAIRHTRCEHLATRPITSMSDGERQRVLIARAVAQSPQVMLLDEPTAFLDIAHRVRLTALLRDFTHQHGVAVLMSTHDLELALRTADTLWLVRRSGELVAAPPEDIALSGILSEEFCDDSLSFEHEAGGFRITPAATRGSIRLAGDDGPARLWTTRALTRVGYDVSHAATDTTADVMVASDHWRLRTGAVAVSIADLLAQLAGHTRLPDSAPSSTTNSATGRATSTRPTSMLTEPGP